MLSHSLCSTCWSRGHLTKYEAAFRNFNCHQLAAELYPNEKDDVGEMNEDAADPKAIASLEDEDDGAEYNQEEDLETALARELKQLKKPRQGSRFGEP